MTINKRLHICCESPEGSIILRSGQQVGGLFHDDRLGLRTCQCRAHAPPRTAIFHPSQHALQLENVVWGRRPHRTAQLSISTQRKRRSAHLMSTKCWEAVLELTLS